MSYIVAEVLTNCEEDEFYRVKLKAKRIWDESPLTPSLNSIYLDKGDQVLVDISLGVDNAVILAKYRNKAQSDKSQKVDGVILQEISKDNDWTQVYTKDSIIHVENSKGVHLTIDGDSITLESTKLELKSDDITLKGKIKLDGTTTFTKSASAPENSGPLCALPKCLFSGAPHVTSKTQ